MRLGFWNRLAIVATGVACLAGPIWYVVSGNNELESLRQAYYVACQTDAQGFLDTGDFDIYRQESQRCLDERYAENRYRYGWPEWREALVETIILSGIVYLLIFSIVRITRWVWRGRGA